ncbi:MAG TPA: hypothetical protein VF181_12825 [Balneolaceae bacterium]
MNLPLVISYIIAGIIMLSIIAMNISVSKSSTELTMTQITREKASSVTEFISQDLQKMGYNKTSRTDPIVSIALGNKIQFFSNIDNSSDKSVEAVTWELTSTGIPETQNPNDKVLLRTVYSVDILGNLGSLIEETSIELGVTGFRISYYDDYGEPLSDSLTTPVADPDQIRQMYIKISFESAEKMYYQIGGDGKYILSVWEKRFSPPNLQPN